MGVKGWILEGELPHAIADVFHDFARPLGIRRILRIMPEINAAASVIFGPPRGSFEVEGEGLLSA